MWFVNGFELKTPTQGTLVASVYFKISRRSEQFISFVQAIRKARCFATQNQRAVSLIFPRDSTKSR